MVSSRGVLVKSQSTSTLPRNVYCPDVSFLQQKQKNLFFKYIKIFYNKFIKCN